MLKTKSEFLDHFARLGVFSKVQALMDDGSESDGCVTVIKSATDIDLATQSTSLATPSSSTSKPSEESASIGNHIHFKATHLASKLKLILNLNFR